MPSSVEIYFSYAWGDDKESGESREKIVDELYDALVQGGFNIIRDKHNLGFTGCISEFMNRIAKGQLIIIGLSEKYLKSQYCMYELMEVFRNSKMNRADLLKRIIPIRTSDDLRFSAETDRLPYIQYWRGKVDDIETYVANNPKESGDITINWKKQFQQIQLEIDNLLHLFSDINTLNKKLLREDNFAEVKTVITNRIRAEEINQGIDQKLELSPTEKIEQSFDDNDLFEISGMDKEAVVISVKQGKYVYFRSPLALEQRCKYSISSERFSEQVTGILQRLLVEDNLREEEFEILGTSLYQRLLHSVEASAAFTTYVEQALRNKQPLKIILRFDEASSQLACLPWEYLYCPFADNKGVFVGECNELILTRRLSVKGNEQSINTPELKVLIAVSEHLKGNDATSDEQMLLLAIQDIPAYSGKKVSGQLEYFSSVNQLADFLGKQQVAYQVVHVFGLAKQLRDTHNNLNYEVALTDTFSLQSDHVSWKNGNEFIACFPAKPSLIFLHAAANSPEETYLALSGFAFQLVKEVPGVLAIQAPPGNTNAITFARYLYKALIQDEIDMDAAVKRSLSEISFFKSKQPRVKVSSYSGKTLRFVFEKNMSLDSASKTIVTVRCKNKLDLSIRQNEICNKEIELIKEGDPSKYTLLESENRICNKCGSDLEFCRQCGYLIPSPQDNFCGACRARVLRREELQQEAMFDHQGSTSIQSQTIKNPS